MQEQQSQEAVLRWLEFAERMVYSFAQNTRAYWRMWGPLGEPMVRSVDVWAGVQHSYLQWLKEISRAEESSSTFSYYREGDELVDGSVREADRGFKEAERIAREAARETERIAKEAEREVAEGVERSPGEDIGSTIRESVRRSEVGRREELQARTAGSEEIRTDAEELPIEDYDSLNVNQVTQRLGELSIQEIERLRDYEAENKNRRSLLQRFETRIKATREDLSSTRETEESPREDIRSIIRGSVRRSQGE
jgi:hypothetical protein